MQVHAHGDELTGKVAVITGGGSGIGRASALALAHRGVHVIVADVNAEGLAQTCALGSGSTGSIRAREANVCHDDDIAQLIDNIMLQERRLDIAVNAAGIGGPELRTADYSEVDWARVIDVNLTGVWRCLRHEIPAMQKNGGGAIVNIASVAGVVGYPRHPAYSASKHGVVGLSRTAALEYAKHGIRVNALCPGFTHTPMVESMFNERLTPDLLAARVPLQRLASSDEIAAGVLFLCSAAGSFVVGHTLMMDGGITAG